MTTATVARLEVHKYAPELNRVHMKNGAVFKAPGCTSVAEWRAATRAPQKLCTFAVVQTHYDAPENKWLEKKYTGIVFTRLQAVDMARRLRRYNPGSVLSDGRVLPPVKVTVKTWIVGS